MRKCRLIVVFAALLMAATMSAQSVESGKVISQFMDYEMSYSFSGGKIIDGGGSGLIEIHYDYEVVAGSTLNFTCSHLKGEKNEMAILVKKNSETKKKVIKNGTASLSYIVPGNVSSFTVYLSFANKSKPFVKINCKVVPDASQTKATPTPAPQPKYTPKYKCQEKDSKIRFNDLYGEVKVRCSLEEDDAFEFAEIETVIYEEDLIKTEEESGAILGLEDMSTYVIKPETKLIIRTEEKNISKFEMLMGSMWSNIKKMAAGKSHEVEMSQCVCGASGTIFAVEEKDGVSKTWLFVGKTTVTSKKTGKKTVMSPGQVVSVGKDGVAKVQKFNIEQGAKKFGIKMEDIRNHYSSQKQTTTTTSAPKGKYARYGVKSGIVKRVVTTAKDRTYTTTWFDDYGRLERSENTKKETKSGNKWVSAANYKFVTIIKDDKQYRLDPGHKRASTYSLSTVTNFLNPEKMVQGYGVQKSGTAKVGDKTCDVFKGKEMKLAGDVTLEHYVWQGIPLKSVETAPDGTTTTTLESLELPSSMDASLFEIPKGYSVK